MRISLKIILKVLKVLTTRSDYPAVKRYQIKTAININLMLIKLSCKYRKVIKEDFNPHSSVSLGYRSPRRGQSTDCFRSL